MINIQPQRCLARRLCALDLVVLHIVKLNRFNPRGDRRVAGVDHVEDLVYPCLPSQVFLHKTSGMSLLIWSFIFLFFLSSDVTSECILVLFDHRLYNLLPNHHPEMSQCHLFNCKITTFRMPSLQRCRW